MQLTINGKDYNVKFGVKFVRTLDEMFPTTQQGMTFGFALTTKIPELLTKNVAALADIIYAGTVTESPRPSLSAVEDFIDENDNIDAVFDEVLTELSKSNAGKSLMQNLDETLQEKPKKK